MWRCAASILADWEGVHDDLFLSVNISPKDFYFIDVVGAIKSLTQEYGIDPSKLRLKAAKVVEDGKALLIIGLMNEDAQIRQEQEYARDLSIARKMATVDSLTGVKNKHAYAQWEEKIDAEIKAGQRLPFAAVVCDVNNLKAVNDLYGHKEGDACILKACRKICAVFSHSPVFRVGGDEFVVLLTGEDYGRRRSLMSRSRRFRQTARRSESEKPSRRESPIIT